jgi:hypothetical protein
MPAKAGIHCFIMASGGFLLSQAIRVAHGVKFTFCRKRLLMNDSFAFCLTAVSCFSQASA